MNKNNTLVFISLAIGFIASTLVKPYPLSWLVKMLPILLLITVTWQHIKQGNSHNSAKFFLFGLIFSVCGDFILDYNRDGWFVFGLGSFFIAHLGYLASLKPFTFKQSNLKKFLILISYGGFGAVMFMLLVDGLGELFIPVFAYMLVLLLMALATVFSRKSNLWLIAGGISFVISDSLIGFDKFNSEIYQSQLWVMATYYFAQFALVKGYLLSSSIASKE